MISENRAVVRKIMRRKNRMRMILKKIHIQNFKGCKDRAVDFGDRTAIKGVNGSGKTTIADAVMWILFGKDSSGASTFDIRPKDKSGVDVDFVDIAVKAEFEVDGRPLEITKTQKQNWVKKRGAEEQTFQGNTNFYEINTIPKSENEFKKYIEELVPEKVFKFVSNTGAFMSQAPSDRRKTLFSLVSNVGDDDVLATDPKLASLSGQLSQFTAEEILSRDKKALLEYKRKLEEIPARIDEVSKTIVEVDYSDKELQLSALREQLSSVENDTSDASVYDQVNQLKTEISKHKSDLLEIERESNSEISKNRNSVQCKIIDADQTISRLTNSVTNNERQAESTRALIKGNEERLAKLGVDYTSEKAKEMAEGVNICPVCKQEYPKSMMDAMKTAFETEKERRLKDINLSGKSVKEAIVSYKAQLEGYEKDIPDAKAEIERLTLEKVKLQQELAALPISVNLSELPSYQSAKQYIMDAELRLEDAYNLIKDVDAKKQAIAEKKRFIQSEIDTVNRILSGKQTIENAKDRVEELKTEQRKLSQDIATVENEVYLLEEFNKAKVNLLSEKINSHFKIVKWKLFERQINGGYNPVCEPLINGQAYSSALNSGHKILAELDIIQALQRIYEVSVPVFLDNAERINDFNVPAMDCQLITLSVTEDPQLIVEGV
jgi:DNA repair exonuclease SbcCD ATPase subunit